MKILGIETSCDETSVSIIEGKDTQTPVTLLSNIVATSLSLHAKTGGIIPETAAREQIKYIIPVIEQTLKEAFSFPLDIDAIAVTYGPGLIGSLLVGVETAKTLAYVWKKPIIPVNHLHGHIYANFIQRTENGRQKTDSGKTENTHVSDHLSSGISAIRPPSSVFRAPVFPILALIVSGAHTDLVLMKKHGDFQLVGGTRDDAAGEAFDKIGRMLNLPYPAGPTIENLALKGNPKAFPFPRPMIGTSDFDFSFSGLKTAVRNFVISRSKAEESSLDDNLISDICASTQQAIIDVLARKAVKAAQKYNVKSILLSGGVAANNKLRAELEVRSSELGVKLFAPAKSLCTDNAAMIAAAAFYNYREVPWQEITAKPELYFD